MRFVDEYQDAKKSRALASRAVRARPVVQVHGDLRRAHPHDLQARAGGLPAGAYHRNGTLIDHKIHADEAVAEARQLGQHVDKVLVFSRYPGRYSSPTPMVNGRDELVDDIAGTYRGAVLEPVSMPAEAPLFLMYTSGTTGKPRGCLSYVTGTSKYYQDIHRSDTYWCAADIGWITGHSYMVYRPTSLSTCTSTAPGSP